MYKASPGSIDHIGRHHQNFNHSVHKNEAIEDVCVFTCSRCLLKEKNKLIKASQQTALERPEATGDPAFLSHLQTPAATRRWHIFPRVPAFSSAQEPLQPEKDRCC